MGKQKLVTVLLAAGIMLTACGGGATKAPEAGKGTDTPKEETKLVIYTARDKAIVDAVIPKFEAKYPEYKGNVEVLTMGAQEIMERVRAEKENPAGDVWWGGTQQSFDLAVKENLLAAVKPSFAEKIPAGYKQKDGFWYGEILLPEVIMYNNQMIKPEEAPKDWDDLLDAKWKGKILIRGVAASGTMRTIYTAMIDRFYQKDKKPDAGFDWLLKLDANTKEYTANPADLYLKMSRQEGSLSLWNLQDILIQAEQKSMPFGYVVPASGAPILVDGIGAVGKAKHPQGAVKFLEFIFEESLRADLAKNFFQIPTMPMADSAKPEWLKKINLKPMQLEWDVMGTNEKAWIENWDKNIKGKGAK